MADGRHVWRARDSLLLRSPPVRDDSGQIDAANGAGFYILGNKRVQIIGSEAQDNVGSGFVLDNSQNCLITGCTADSNGTGGGAHGFALVNSSTLNVVQGVTYDRNGTPLQAFGLRLDSNVSANSVDLVIGAVLTGGISGNLGNNRVRIIRGAGSARENFFTNLEFSADNTYDIGVTSQRPRDLLLARNAIIGGGLKTAVAFTNSASYTVSSTDSVIFNNTGSNTTTLPAAASNSGRLYIIRNVSTSMTVASAGGNVDGGATATLAGGASARYVSDGTNWWSV